MESLPEPLTFYRLHFLAGIGTSQFSLWKSGTRRPSDGDLQKLAAVPQLGLSLNRLKGWRAIDEYGPEAILSAIEDAKTAQGG